MRHCLLLLFFALSLFFASDVEARKMALLIGVDDYKSIRPLRCCVNDMKALKEALKKIGFHENDIIILTTGGSVRELPTKENIEEMVNTILSVAKPNDLVFFAFSGHGVREDKTDYFCPPFVDQKDIKNTCVSITKVMNDLSTCNASFKWMVVDACRNDPNNARDARSFEVISAPPAGIALLQSCNGGQCSYEEKRPGGHGYFTKNLVAALKGDADSNHDGELTVLEVCSWTANQTKAEVKSKEGLIQEPFLNFSATNFTLVENLQDLMPRNYPAPLSEKHDLSITGKIEGERNTISISGIKFSFRWCPPGMYTMGSPSGEPGKDELSEESNLDFDKIEKQHSVKLTKGFWIMETEVTVGMFKAFVSDTGYVSKGDKPFGCEDNRWDQDSKYSWRNPGFHQDDNHPVTCVSWNDAVAFCKWLSKKTGQKIQLPTEAQWEYACRAGSLTALPNGSIDIMGANDAPALDLISWYGGNSSQGFIGFSGMDSRAWEATQYPGGLCGTHPVGKKAPNRWEIFDMIGNVWEWCADWYGDYPDGSVTDPTGLSSGTLRVCRGGSWLSGANNCRSAFRYGITPGRRIGALGFRCVAIPSRW